jgi:hypothetical protein
MTTAQPTPTPALQTSVTYLALDQVSRPPGVRVVEPPVDARQALRGNLYAVVELSGENPEREAFAERLLSVIQRTYYTVKSSQSFVLGEALREAKGAVDNFNAANPTAPVRAGIIIAALLRDRLMITSNELGLALITAGRTIDVYPPYTGKAPSNAEDEAAASEGWPIYRQELADGGALFIGGRGWLDYLPLRELASTVAYLTPDNCAEAAAVLLEQCDQPALPGLLITLTPNTRPSAVPAPPPTGLPGALRRNRGVSLPTALNASPPVHTLPAAASVHTAGSRAEVPTAAMRTQAPPTALESVTDAPIASTATEGILRLPTSATLTKLTDEMVTRLRDGWGQLQALFASLTPDRPSHRSGSATADPPRPVQEAIAAAPRPPADFAPVEATRTPPLTAPPRTTGSRARLLLLIAVLIVVLVPIIVAVGQWQQGASARADVEMLLDLADARLASARESLDAEDQVNARALLVEAQGHVDQARTLAVGRSVRADELAVAITRELQEVQQIQPLYGLVEPLVRFPASARPHRVLVVDQDIYVLDLGQQVVQHFQLDLSTNTVPDQAGDVILRQGDTVEDAQVGRLVAMTWQLPIPGIEDRPALLILDRNNNVFRYDQRVEGITRIRFADQSAWRTPTQLYSFAGRLYLVDEGANQIFRYPPGDYSQPPEPWFQTQTPVNLNGVQAMTIDGDIWLLFTSGEILRYNQGRGVPFTLENSIPLAGEPVDLAVGDQENSLIYLADRSESRILVFDKQGNYQRQLQAAEGDPLAGLSALFANEAAGTLYILTETALYQHALPN